MKYVLSLYIFTITSVRSVFSFSSRSLKNQPCSCKSVEELQKQNTYLRMLVRNLSSKSNFNSCGENELGYSGKCFILIDEASNFQSAEQKCQSLGKSVKLAKVTSNTLSTILQTFIRSKLLNGIRDVWVDGLYDSYRGVVQWSDYTTSYVSYWREGYPFRLPFETNLMLSVQPDARSRDQGLRNYMPHFRHAYALCEKPQ